MESGKAKTTQRILGAAQTLFMKYGYSRVVVDDIVRELGMSKKTIYNHYSGKTAILMACIDQFALDYERRADAILSDKQLPIRQKLTAYLELIGLSFSNFTQEFWVDIKRSEPEAWQKICVFRRDIPLKNFSQLMDDGVREGYLRDDSSRHLAILMLIATMQQLTDPDYLIQFPAEITDAVPLDSAQRVEQVVNILLRGVLTPGFSLDPLSE
ncbi:TetR/AcrR family transcriptional regulator [Spirosoma aerophilum]